MMRPVSRNGLLAAMATFALPLAISAQVLSGTIACPFYDGKISSILAGESVAIGGQAKAGRFDLFLHSDDDYRISFYGLGVQGHSFWIGAAALDIPSFNPGFEFKPIDAFCIPMVGVGFSFGGEEWASSVSLVSASIPRISQDFSSLSASLVTDRAISLFGSLERDDVSLLFGLADFYSRIKISGVGQVGNLFGEIAAVGLDYRGCGFLCGYVSAEENLKEGEENILLELLGIDLPWAVSSSSIDAGFGAAWYRLKMDRVAWGMSLDAIAAVFAKKDFSMDTTIHTSVDYERRWLWAMTSKTSGFALLRPALYWRLARDCKLTVARSLPWIWGWRSSNAGEGKASATGASAYSRLNYSTLALSGLQLSLSCSF
jgi:hypothetical protein